MIEKEAEAKKEEEAKNKPTKGKVRPTQYADFCLSNSPDVL